MKVTYSVKAHLFINEQYNHKNKWGLKISGVISGVSVNFIHIQINTLGGAINNPALEASAAYPHRQELFLGELQVYWDRESQGARAVKSVQAVQGMLTQSGITKHYRNYPDIDLPNWQQAYYGNNYPRLQQLKQRYDPDNLFQHPQSVEVTG